MSEETKKFLNLQHKKCSDYEITNLHVVSRPNPYTYYLEWDGFGTGGMYIIKVTLPNGEIETHETQSTNYTLIIGNPNGRYQISVSKKCSCSSQSLDSTITININPCGTFDLENPTVEGEITFDTLQDWYDKCLNCVENPFILSNFSKNIISENIVEFSFRLIKNSSNFIIQSGDIRIYPITPIAIEDTDALINKIEEFCFVISPSIFNNVEQFQDFSWQVNLNEYNYEENDIDSNYAVSNWDMFGISIQDNELKSIKSCRVIKNYSIYNNKYKYKTNLSPDLDDFLINLFGASFIDSIKINDTIYFNIQQHEIPDECFSQGFGENLEEVKSSCNQVGINSFTFCLELKIVDMPNCTIVGKNSFYSCTFIEEINFPELLNIEEGGFGSCESIKIFDFPNLLYINEYCFMLNKDTEVISMPKLYYMPPYNPNPGFENWSSFYLLDTGSTIQMTIPIVFQTNGLNGNKNQNLIELESNNNTVIYNWTSL